MSRVKPLVLGLLVGWIPRALRRRLGSVLGRGGPNEIDLLVGIAEALGLTGTVVDVGARYGTAAEPFARRGQPVLAFEPDAANRRVLKYVSRFLPSLSVDPRAVSDLSRSGVPFFVSPGRTSLSSLLPFDESHCEGGTVDVTTLTEALREHEITEVDILKVDAEGNDLKVLRGLDWSGPARPKLVMCEFDGGKVEAGGHSYEEVVGLLEDVGYRILVSEWLPVQQYGASDHQWRCVEWHPHVVDGPLSHGNLIAVDPTIPRDNVDPVVSAWREAMS